MHTSCLVNAFIFSNFEKTLYITLLTSTYPYKMQINVNLMFSLLKQQCDIFWSLLLIKAFL